MYFLLQINTQVWSKNTEECADSGAGGGSTDQQIGVMLDHTQLCGNANTEEDASVVAGIVSQVLDDGDHFALNYLQQ